MSDRVPPALSVTLYVKDGCHLCEAAEAHLEALRPRYPHTLERVDISTDPALLERYAEQIPVLGIGGQEYAAAMGREMIERALRQAVPRGQAGAVGSARTFPWGDWRGRGR